MNHRKLPGELELLVLRHLKELKHATVHEIQTRMTQKYAYTTLMTILTRLYRKKTVTREKQGRQFVYSIAQDTQSKSILNRLKLSLFKGKLSEMVHYLIETSDSLSSKDFEEMQEIISRYKND